MLPLVVTENQKKAKSKRIIILCHSAKNPVIYFRLQDFLFLSKSVENRLKNGMNMNSRQEQLQAFERLDIMDELR
jgi:hypothetical protein